MIVFAGLFFLYRSCTQGYTDYAFFVHAKNKAVFKTVLSDSNKSIIECGRKLILDIILIDREIDKGNGPDQIILSGLMGEVMYLFNRYDRDNMVLNRKTLPFFWEKMKWKK